MLYVQYIYSVYCTSGPLLLKATVLSYTHIPTPVVPDFSPSPAYKIRVSEMAVLHASQIAFFQERRQKW